MADNYPVIIGTGRLTNRPEAIDQCVAPIDMMERVARDAESDAGVSGILSAADSVQVVNIIAWQYADAPGLLGTRLGATPSHTLYSSIGGETPQRLVNETAQAIAEGRTRIALLAGAEAMHSRRLARAADERLPWSDRGVPESITGDMRVGFSEIEARHGATTPPRIYPLFENAIRAHLGQSIDEHQRHVGDLYARFATVAADNPGAWFREAYSPEDITAVTPDNRMICFPYTKRMNAIMDVDQAAALIVTGSRTARELGVPEDRWVYLHGCGDANDTWYVGDRTSYHSSPAIRAATQRALGMAGVTTDGIAAFDLYSCFPSAVQLALDALDLAPDDERPFTVTGGLAYHGGPGNNYVMHSIGTMVDRLRASPGDYGLVTGLGWFATKHSAGVYSGKPPTGDWQRTDPAVDQASVDALPSPPFVEEAEGPAEIETYTVAFDRDGNPEQAIVIGRLTNHVGAKHASPGAGGAGLQPTHPRFFANTSPDRDLLIIMTRQDFIGHTGRVSTDATRRNIFIPA
jgi:acetyl-CoA C-acetyltransferase